MSTAAIAPTGVRLNVHNPEAQLYVIALPNGSYYSDNGEQAWTFNVATAIARNISRKRRCVTTLHKVVVEEVVNSESYFDRILSYVDSLKGRHLTDALLYHGLVKGGDPVASKRERLISHYTKCRCDK